MKPQNASDLISQVTRREWLLRLGETVALAGVSGLVPETSLRLFQAEQASMALPPGLYDPSSDQLVHALGSHQHFAPPVGSETDYIQPGAPYALQFFSPEEFRSIRSVVSILLGNTEDAVLTETAQWVDLWFHSADGVREAARNLDPQHRTLSVAYFGETTVREIENLNPGAAVHEGLTALEKLCMNEHHQAFANLEITEQKQIVSRMSNAPLETPLRNFYDLLRHEAIRGYYTSAAGLRELDHKGNAYYPYCPGCEEKRS